MVLEDRLAMGRKIELFPFFNIIHNGGLQLDYRVKCQRMTTQFLENLRVVQRYGCGAELLK